MDTNPADRKLSRAGWGSGLWKWLVLGWRWLLSVLRGPVPAEEPPSEPEPLPQPPGRLRERRSLASPLVVPASGYIFDFNVYATCVWGSTGLYRAELVDAVRYLMPYVVREMKALAANEGRHHPPHHAEQFEIRLQQILANRDVWRYRWGGTEVTCRASVWVGLDERVKRAVEPYWEQLIKLDCEHNVQLKKVEYANRLSREWLDVLTDLVGNPLADGAAKMTEVALSSVVEKIVAERKSASAKLDKLLEEKAYGGDLFDQEERYELLKARLEAFATTAFAGVTRLPLETGPESAGGTRNP